MKPSLDIHTKSAAAVSYLAGGEAEGAVGGHVQTPHRGAVPGEQQHLLEPDGRVQWRRRTSVGEGEGQCKGRGRIGGVGKTQGRGRLKRQRRKVV